jgi:hypothetical protein
VLHIDFVVLSAPRDRLRPPEAPLHRFIESVPSATTPPTSPRHRVSIGFSDRQDCTHPTVNPGVLPK